MKLFSTKTHGVLDYVTGGALLILPSLLNWSPNIGTVVRGSALSTLGASLLTRYEFGVLRVLPMPAHLTLDVLNGTLFCAAPFLFPDEDSSVTGTLVGLGLFELFTALNTETTPSFDRQQLRTADTFSGSASGLRDPIYDVVQ